MDTNLNGRVIEIGEIRIGGLGGIFRESIWHPKIGTESRFRRPSKYLTHLIDRKLLDGRERLAETAIFPATYDVLADMSAEVLVTHGAPSCHRYGFEELDILAEAMGATLIVHGHHHEAYELVMDNGITVIGLGRAQPRVIEITSA